MRLRHKILVGAVALALPTSSVLLSATPAMAKKPLPNPITCDQLGGTVDFAAPGLSATGAHMLAKTSVTSVDNIVMTCAGTGPTSAPSSLAVTIKNVKDPKVKGQARTYTYGTFGIFFGAATAIKKSIKTVDFTVNGSDVLFKTKAVAIDPGVECINTSGNTPVSEVGFILSGQVKLPPYNVAGTGAEIRVCLGDDAGTNITHNFISDLGSTDPSVVITSATIDPETSEATL